jgi:hypothetical protein
MIKSEIIEVGQQKKSLKRFYSDSGFMIMDKSTKKKYVEAVEQPDSKRTFVETSEKIPYLRPTYNEKTKV